MRRPAIQIGALTLAALLLRIVAVAAEPFWLDEAGSLTFAREGLAGTLFAEISHPPLFRLILHFWIRLAGESELAVRLPSVVLGALSVPLAFAVARHLFSRRVAWWTAVLTAASPYLVHFSQEARNYSLFLFLTLAATLLFLRLRETPSLRRGALYAAAAALGLHTHYFFAFVILAHGLQTLGSGPLRRRAFFLSAAGAAVAFAPWAGWVATHWESQERAWMHPPLVMTADASRRMAGGYGLVVHHVSAPPDAPENSLPARLVPVLLLLATAGAGFRAAWRTGAAPLLAGILLVPPVVLVLIHALGGPALAADRTYIFASVFLYLLAAAGIAEVRRGAVLGVALLMVFALGHAAWHVNPRAGKEEWDAVGRWLDERSGPEDVVLAHKPYLRMALRPYRHGPAPLLGLPAPDAATLEDLLEKPEVRGARRVLLVLAHSAWDTKEEWVRLLDERLLRKEECLFPKLWGIRTYSWEGRR